MILNYIFSGFFIVGLLFALLHILLTGEWTIFNDMVGATFNEAKNGFEISLYLTGVLSLWLGFMKIAERSGLIAKVGHFASPVLCRLFPSIPKNHPVLGNIFMNISANMLGLDNAATPLGIRSMERLQSLNDKKERATDAMIMFLAINASGLTLIPTSIMAFRMQAGAGNPADVFLPILIATATSTLTAIAVVAIKQRINLFQKPLLLLFGFTIAFIAIMLWASRCLNPDVFAHLSSVVSAVILFSVIIAFIMSGLLAKVNVFEAFIDGAKGGFEVAVGIIPYLIALLVAIGVFRASGAMDFLSDGLRALVGWIGLDTQFVDGLPTILMKPLSGSGSRGLMVDAMHHFGPDSFVGRLCSTVQGCSDTTFYVVAVYYGAVGIKNTRYTVGASLLADLTGAVMAIIVTYMFFA
ncbi:nucleoside recognition domain-containing protein [Falsiporphyromonas endometrii]|uniref:Nucleoside recognition domain-containing protein n=1 Tax=Falsiporphyromonas endometrii TaxID=1387297 RepID=A0ABV9K9M1_9PORP